MSALQFSDEWAHDAVLFALISGEGCLCCGLSSLSLTQQDKINLCTDFDTDDKRQNSTDSSWPTEFRDAVWDQRVQLRLALKHHCETHYAPLLRDDRARFNAIANWWMNKTSLSLDDRLSIFSWSTKEIHSLAQQFGAKREYALVLTVILQQLAHFSRTKMRIQNEAHSQAELAIASSIHLIDAVDEIWCLEPEKIGCKIETLDVNREASPDSAAAQSATASVSCDCILARLLELCQSQILPKKQKVKLPLSDEDESNTHSSDTQAEFAKASLNSASAGLQLNESFRSDRRLLRCIMCISAIDEMIKKIDIETKAQAAGDQSLDSELPSVAS